MLTTQQDHLLPTFPFAAGPGVSTWRAVTLHVGVVYIFVRYSIKHGRGGWLPQTTVFWRHEDVLDFCKKCNKSEDKKLAEVFLLVPNTQEQSHGWAFVQIREIFATRDDQADGDFPFYVTADGERLSGISFGETDEDPEVTMQKPAEKVFPL